MNKLLITTKENTDKLLAMMYLDIGQYSFQKTEEGILIDFDELNPDSLPCFSDRFSEWFSREAFVINGNQYFENHKHQEKWKIWKNDFRFLEAYCDDVYNFLVAKRWKELLYALEEYFGIQINLEELFNQYYELIEMRMDLINQHFTEGIHEDYIMLRLSQWEPKNDEHGMILEEQQ